jgi:hypothetical protein
MATKPRPVGLPRVATCCDGLDITSISQLSQPIMCVCIHIEEVQYGCIEYIL